MAALLTSVIDNPGKVAEYILHCKQVGIGILPPDVNRSEGNFSVEGNSIRYGLSAIKGIGGPVFEVIARERKMGAFTSLKNFAERTLGHEINKRTIENFIKAGALDCLDGTRKQFMMVYPQIMDAANQERKSSISGQMSLFDLFSEEEKKEYEIRLPDVGEYTKEEKLFMEKEVMGVYISGHPLEEYEERWRKNISAVTADFLPDEETGQPKVTDGAKEIVGGMILEKTVKYTKNNKMMAFLTLEDLLGTVEIVVFPRDYEKYAAMLETDKKVFIHGRVSAEDDKASKLICEKVWSFEDARRELWIQFESVDEYEKEELRLYDILSDSDGNDSVVIYVKNPKAIKRLPSNRNVLADKNLLSKLFKVYTERNVKVVEKSIEKQPKMN